MQTDKLLPETTSDSFHRARPTLFDLHEVMPYMLAFSSNSNNSFCCAYA